MKTLRLRDIQSAVNVADLLPEEDLTEIGHKAHRAYEADEQSRADWKKKNTEATKLALQITEDKSYPWESASNVKFPLLTIAAIQFSSRAYPALVKTPDIVKFRVQGDDPQGQKAARAQRISAHMSYQILEEDEDWEEEHDKALLAVPILGCVFKKSYHDPIKEHNCSELVLPNNLCVNYYAKKLENASKTHIFNMHSNEIRERVLSGLFLEHELGPMPVGEQTDADVRQGTTPPADTEDRPRIIHEYHTLLDLDGDGYKEPYVVTYDKTSRKVFRIVHRFKKVVSEQSLKVEENRKRVMEIVQSLPPPQEGQPQDVNVLRAAEATIQQLETENEALMAQKPKVLRITPIEYFTKIPFISSPDGGFYDIGFGSLLSPLNDSVNTLINQLIDSGSLQNGSVGFIGKGARIKGGKVRFSPNEWKRVDVAGATLRDALVPLPVNQPSAVLFQLLGLLINYTERVSSITDTMAGENPGQNTPAYNYSAMLEQGLQVFNGIFKRVYRSMRSEVRKLYDLNSLYLDEFKYFEYQDKSMEVLKEDYWADRKDLIPAADPNAFSSKEKQMKAQVIAERAMMVPGYSKISVEQRFLEAMDIPDAAEVFPVVQNPETGDMELVFPPAPDPEIELKKAEEERRSLEAKDRAEVNYMLAASKIAVDEAQILKIMADAEASADSPELERMKLMLEEMADRRKMLLGMAQLEKQDDNSGTDS